MWGWISVQTSCIIIQIRKKEKTNVFFSVNILYKESQTGFMNASLTLAGHAYRLIAWLAGTVTERGAARLRSVLRVRA